MSSLISRTLRRIRFGEPLILVSGLPRSGTSMAMKMLEAGGFKIVSDGIREADVDNPKGYFELERVKELDKGGDKSWLGQYKGQVIKIISFLLTDLPEDLNYKIIFMRRNLDEVIASQNKMLDHRNEAVEPGSDERMRALYERHLRKIHYFMKTRPGIEFIEVDHREAVKDPAGFARKVREFLGTGDLAKMSEVVDPQLYRNRK